MDEILQTNKPEKPAFLVLFLEFVPRKKNKEADKIWRLIKESEKETRRLMLEAKTLLRSMYEASNKQPNINEMIKDGLPVIDEILESIADNRYSILFARYRLTERSVEKQWAAANPARERSDSRMRAIASSSVSSGGRRLLKEWTKVHLKQTRKRRLWIKKEVVTMATQQNATQPQSEAHDRKIERASEKETKNTEKKKSYRKAKPDEILLIYLEGKTYVDVLSVVRREIKPEVSGLEVRAVGKIRMIGVLLELCKATADVRDSFAEALKNKVSGYCSQVKHMAPDNRNIGLDTNR